MDQKFMPVMLPANGSGALMQSIEMLDTLGISGMAVTPNEPTASMLQAGAAVGGVTRDVVRQIYQVMLQAEG